MRLLAEQPRPGWRAEHQAEGARPPCQPKCESHCSGWTTDGTAMDGPDHPATALMSSLIGTDDPLRSSQVWCSRHPNRRPLLFQSVRRDSIRKPCQTLAGCVAICPARPIGGRHLPGQHSARLMPKGVGRSSWPAPRSGSYAVLLITPQPTGGPLRNPIAMQRASLLRLMRLRPLVGLMALSFRLLVVQANVSYSRAPAIEQPRQTTNTFVMSDDRSQLPYRIWRAGGEPLPAI